LSPDQLVSGRRQLETRPRLDCHSHDQDRRRDEDIAASRAAGGKYKAQMPGARYQFPRHEMLERL
jgi:hypothetical protein